MARIATSAALVLALLAAPAAAQQLEIHTLSVGSGDCALIVSPTGTTVLVDTGRPGAGAGIVIPYLQSLGIFDLDYILISHYDGDHISGVPDLIAAGYTPQAIYDRGDFDAEMHPLWQDYVAAAGALRTTITTGMVLDLGGGVTMQHWIQNGEIWNGPTLGVLGKVENAKSAGWVLSYGDFSYGTFGDIAVFLENALGPLVGNLDVYKASHHGSSTSSGPNWIAATDPDVVFVSSGPTSSNPKQSMIDTSNSASGMRWVYLTSDSENPTWGGRPAYDHMVLRTDGTTYTISGNTVATQTFLVDEVSWTPADVGDVAVGEFLALPSVVVDEEGEFLEITNLTDEVLPLRGWTFRDTGSDSVTIASNAVLGPRETLLVSVQGDVARNGGIVPGAVWPRDGFVLDNGPDEVIVELGPTTLVDIATPGTAVLGKSWERKNLYFPGTAGNYAVGMEAFGLGDLGTPGARNTSDTTPWIPNLKDLTPDSGTVLGGNWITLDGFDLAVDETPQVTFGLLPAAAVQVLGQHQVRAQAPALVGKIGLVKLMLRLGLGDLDLSGPAVDVDLTLSTSNGTSALPRSYRYTTIVEPGAQVAK